MMAKLHRQKKEGKAEPKKEGAVEKPPAAPPLEIKKSTLWIASAIIAVIAIVALYFFAFQPEVVEAGDLAEVQYKGELPNGEVFGDGVLNVSAGTGQVIKGFDNALLGMKKGETKKVTLLPEEAYGDLKDELMGSMNKFSTIERTRTIPLNDAQNLTTDEIKVGASVNFRGLDWPALIKKVNKTDVTFDHMPVLNSTYYPFEYPFPIKIVSLTKDNFTIEQLPKAGQSFIYKGAQARIVIIKEDLIVYDTNHPLAGKTLIFTIKILNLEKKQQQ